METRLELEILPQPDETTCGPTCLHAIYRYYGEDVSLPQLIDESHSFETGGTLAVFLACHALRRGYRAAIYTYNLEVFDPTWFVSDAVDLSGRLSAQLEVKRTPRLELTTEGYLEFLRLGGNLRFEDLRPKLIRHYLNRGVPIITGLSATYLYHSARELELDGRLDDIRGDPAGHFVVLSGYRPTVRSVLIADPLQPNPMASGQTYEVGIDRVVGAILLGVLTHDANLLVITPRAKRL